MNNLNKIREDIVEDIFAPKERAVLEFCILNGLDETALGSQAQKAHRHPFYEMIYIKKCDGEHIVDYRTYNNLENMIFLVSPGQTHYWKNVTEAEGFLVYFTENFLFNSNISISSIWELQLFKDIAQQPAIRLNESETEKIESLLDFMLDEYKKEELSYPDVLRSCLNVLLIYFQRIHNRTTSEDRRVYLNPSMNQLFNRFENILNQKICENLSVSEYATLLGVSTGHLNEQTRKCKGMSAGMMIKQERIVEIKRLLLHTEMNISEIAEKMNFQDTGYFSRSFKKETGMTPLEFRKAQAEKSSSYRNDTKR